MKAARRHNAGGPRPLDVGVFAVSRVHEKQHGGVCQHGSKQETGNGSEHL